MLLSLSTTHAPATDLGFLLHKHPARPQSVALAFGEAHVFYPEATAARCTCALSVEVDPVALVRDRRPGADFALAQYVNDRPYAASSFLSVALGRVFGTAMSGRCKDRPVLAEAALPLEAAVSAVPCRGGATLVRRLFEPLGYAVATAGGPLDAAFPQWGDSPYLALTLAGTVRLQDLLSHLYVLLPVLDTEKHYWVGPDEVEKLLRHGEGWLAAHPERELIAHRYLKRRRSLAREAIARLAAVAEDADADDADAAAVEGPGGPPPRPAAFEDEAVDAPLSLNDRRMRAVVETLEAAGVSSVVDLGCGEGRFLAEALRVPRFTRLVGLDVSVAALELARKRLGLDRLPEAWRDRVALLHGSLVYRDPRLTGFDAAVCVEVIEHLDPGRLRDFEHTVLGYVRPPLLVVTTPNAEYNPRLAGLSPGELRHRDHRFEWTRAEFAAWADAAARRHGYRVAYAPVGPVDPAAPEVGAPTQMAVFRAVEAPPPAPRPGGETGRSARSGRAGESV